MAGYKITSLQQVTLQSTDSIPVGRSTDGTTRRIVGSELLNRFSGIDSRITSLSSTVDSRITSLSSTVDSRITSLSSTVNSRITSLSSTVDSRLNTLSSSTVTMMVPTGAIMVFPAISAPTGWLALSGQTVLRSGFSSLWAFAQSSGNLVTSAQWTSLSAYGSFSDGDGSTTFRLPDLRGHFVRGSGTHTDGTVAGAFGVKQVEAFKAHTHSTPTGAYSQYNETGGGGVVGQLYNNGSSTGSTGGTETRPNNIALLYCIKT